MPLAALCLIPAAFVFMSFEKFNFDARIMRAIAEAHYDVPTPVQNETIPVSLAGKDLIGTAQTGTGKTAAFVLPILQKLLATPRGSGVRKTKVLIITPTRELAEQINQHVRLLAKYAGVRSATVYGGVGFGPQYDALRNGTEIIVACPGRLLDHLSQRSADLSQLHTLVLDEADRMFDMGFLPNIKRIVEQVPKDRQTMLFSATFPREIEDLARHILSSPSRIAVGLTAPPTTVSHALYPVAGHLKTKLLIDLLKKTDAFSMLVFTRTKHRASKIAKQIQDEGFKTAALHGNKSQNQRQQALDGFRSGKIQVMVATDIAARGLDVSTVSHVINYDIPDTADTYIHRIGRTGRAQREGDAFTLISPEDREEVRMIEKALGKPIERRTLEGFDYSTQVHTMGLAADRDDRPERPPMRGGHRGAPSQPRRDGGAPAYARPRNGFAPRTDRPEDAASGRPPLRSNPSGFNRTTAPAPAGVMERSPRRGTRR